MTEAIATQLQSLTNSQAELINFAQTDSHWQRQIDKALISPASSYLAIPQTVEALATIVKQAQQQQWQMIPCGSGTKLDWGGLAKEIDLIVSTQKLNRIIEHAEGDLTVTVQAGVTLATLQAQLQATGQFLPLDPAYPQQATIGGIVATADTGSWRQGYGGVRDVILGLSFVRADGEIAKAGGRVVKNVAGYDLMKLFTGSYGTLGVITQVTFRTYPLPEASKTVILTGETDKIAKAAQILKNSSLSPTAVDLLSNSTVAALNIGEEIALVVRFQTIAASVQQQSAQVEQIGQQLGLKVSLWEQENEQNLWQRLSQTIRNPGSETAITCKIGIEPSIAVTLLQQLTNSTSELLGMIHLGSGIGLLQFVELKKAIFTMRSLCQQHGGFLSILTAPKPIKQQLDSWGYTGNALGIMRKIKQQFDPKSIFSSGRFVGGI